jgi:GntR family negative regulator for fad regulon and positive regulator of fabA
MESTLLPRPAEYAEAQLINAILDGSFPIGSSLPAERDLSARIGVTRPTLREAMQRLARDGWLDIHQGKPTRVRDYWREGNLGVLNALAHRSWAAPDDFIPNLLSVRLALAPAYTRQAVERRPAEVFELLNLSTDLPGEPLTAARADAPPHILQVFASYDWKLHHGLTILSGNAIFTLIINGFCDLYIPMAQRYFRSASTRAASRAFYADLRAAAGDRDASAAERITRSVMQASLEYWQQSN